MNKQEILTNENLVNDNLTMRELINITMEIIFEDNKIKSFQGLKIKYKNYVEDINIYWAKEEILNDIMNIEYKIKKLYTKQELLDFINHKIMIGDYVE
jgi:hypothetical protein